MKYTMQRDMDVAEARRALKAAEEQVSLQNRCSYEGRVYNSNGELIAVFENLDGGEFATGYLVNSVARDLFGDDAHTRVIPVFDLSGLSD